MDSPSQPGLTSRIIRVRRKRSANPHSGLLLTDAVEEEAAGPSKRARAEDVQEAHPTAFRLIGTLPMPDVRDAARLFLNTNTPKKVELVDFDATNDLPVQSSHVVPVEVDGVDELLNESVRKVTDMKLAADANDPFYLAVPDQAPLARPESDLGGGPDDEDEDYVYDFYHTDEPQLPGAAGSSSSSSGVVGQLVNVRLPTDAELQLYFGLEEEGESQDEADDDGDADSNAENYHANDYPDEEDLERGLENDTTSEDSYDHYGDEKSYDQMYRAELSSDEEGSVASGMVV